MPHSPLLAAHEQLGARFTDFGGWRMPVQYTGVLAEHAAVRTGVGVFDVSHLGRFQMEGPGATDLVSWQLTNDATGLEPGRAQYTLSLNQGGGIIDDIIVLRLGDERWWILPNGVNYDRVAERFSSAGSGKPSVEKRRHDTAFLAVQGPEARPLAAEVLGLDVGRFRVVEHSGEFGDLVVAGTGYTGERGVEVTVHADHAEALWNALLSGGAEPCGLGARDTLRLEKGYPLWGQDLDEDTTPLEAGLAWVVDWNHDFVGRAAIESQRSGDLRKKLISFTTAGRKVARTGYPMRAGGSRGAVTSGNFSPTLQHGIGMGYLAPPSDGSGLEVEIRGEWMPVEPAETPFV